MPDITINTKVPSRAHPEFIQAQTRRDDLPTRAATNAAAELYVAWGRVEDTLHALSDKSKARTFLATENTKAVAKAERAVKYIKELEATHTTAIKLTIGKLPGLYAAELRAHYRSQKNPFSEILKDAATPETAKAVYGVPPQLLGLTAEQAELIKDRIEALHAADDYMTRQSARKAADALDAAVSDFHTRNMKRLQQFERHDDVIIERAARAKTEAA